MKESLAAVRRIIDGFGFMFLEVTCAHGEGVLNEGRGDWQAAYDVYVRQQSADPTVISVRRDLSRALRHLGRNDEALELIESHLASSPVSPASNIEAARVQLRLRDAAGAREHLARAARALAMPIRVTA